MTLLRAFLLGYAFVAVLYVTLNAIAMVRIIDFQRSLEIGPDGFRWGLPLPQRSGLRLFGRVALAFGVVMTMASVWPFSMAFNLWCWRADQRKQSGSP
jgi:hypothetical protein